MDTVLRISKIQPHPVTFSWLNKIGNSDPRINQRFWEYEGSSFFLNAQSNRLKICGLEWFWKHFLREKTNKYRNLKWLIHIQYFMKGHSVKLV